MAEIYPIEAWLPEEEIEALDQACEVLGLYEADSHSWLARRCLLYGLLSLRDDGLPQFPDAATPEFVRQYIEAEAALLAKRGSTTAESADPAVPLSGFQTAAASNSAAVQFGP